jgi:hypothetical protein
VICLRCALKQKGFGCKFCRQCSHLCQEKCYGKIRAKAIEKARVLTKSNRCIIMRPCL